MNRVFLDAQFTRRELRWGGILEAAMWLTSLALFASLVAWSL